MLTVCVLIEVDDVFVFFSAVRMPEKLTVYTTLVGLLNAKNYNAGGEVTTLMHKNNKFRHAEIGRFLCICTNFNTTLNLPFSLLNCLFEI